MSDDAQGARHARPGIRTTNLAAVGEAPPAVNAGAFPGVLSGACSFLVGCLMVVAAALAIVDAARLPTTSDPLGPAAFPFAIGGLLGLVGIALVAVHLRFATVLVRAHADIPRGALVSRGNLLRAGAVVLLLVLFAVVLPFAGFFVAAAALYVAAALLLGAPLGWHLPITGVLLAGAVVLVFDRLIGLTLPAGPWGF